MRWSQFSLSLVAVIVLSGCSDGTDGSDAHRIKIGGGFALSGKESGLDLPAANGAKLAAEEINAAGKVLGRQIELILHDSQYDMDVTAEIAKQFAEQDAVVAAVGFTDSDSVLAFGPIMQQAGIPFLTAGATSPRLPSEIGDNIFMACFGDNVQAAAGADFAFQKFGGNAYLLWDDEVEYTTLLANYFKVRFTQLGGTIVLEDRYDDNTTDFSAQIAKVRALREQPDFYYISAMPYNIGPVVKQFRDAGIGGPIVGGDGYDDPDWIRLVGNASNNVFFTTHAFNDPSNPHPGYRKFYDAYETKYGYPPENAFAALGYDAVYLMVDAIRRAGLADPAAIRKALGETEGFPGITGTINLNAAVRIPQKDVTIIALKDAKYMYEAGLMPQQVPAP